jgi:ribose/xylose/arabinose/galactoside ABC-type transport system permease subunit
MTRDKKEESVMEGGFYQLPHRISRKPLGLLLLLTFFLVVLPIIIRDKVYILHLLSMIYLNVVIILGLVLILGYTKQFSLGQVAFYGIGAYTTAVLTTNYHLSFFLALVLSGLLAGISAVFVAIPATRFQGPWLALVTFAFGEIIRILMIRLKSITGGFGGFFNIPKPRWGSFVFDDNFKFYYIFLAVMLSILAITYCLRLSPLGRIWICMGDNEDLSSSLGINNFFHKLLAFALGSFFAGMPLCRLRQFHQSRELYPAAHHLLPEYPDRGRFGKHLRGRSGNRYLYSVLKLSHGSLPLGYGHLWFDHRSFCKSYSRGTGRWIR